jgi:nitrate/TMAO reductase-like tetraheme cytochrome c subunit
MANIIRNLASTLAGLLLVSSGALQASGDHLKTPADPLYLQECGSCHAPYPARLLSASSWQAIMNGLDQHFGSDASLDDKNVADTLQRYLLGNARRKDTLDENGNSVRRITETRWFRHEHDEVPESVWQSPAVKSPSNCGACHTTADQGRFSEHNQRMPR